MVYLLGKRFAFAQLGEKSPTSVLQIVCDKTPGWIIWMILGDIFETNFLHVWVCEKLGSNVFLQLNLTTSSGSSMALSPHWAKRRAWHLLPCLQGGKIQRVGVTVQTLEGNTLWTLQAEKEWGARQVAQEAHHQLVLTGSGSNWFGGAALCSTALRLRRCVAPAHKDNTAHTPVLTSANSNHSRKVKKKMRKLKTWNIAQFTIKGSRAIPL